MKLILYPHKFLISLSYTESNNAQSRGSLDTLRIVTSEISVAGQITQQDLAQAAHEGYESVLLCQCSSQFI